MTLVRPLMTNFKMTVKADCTVLACNPLLLSIKALSLWLLGGKGKFQPLYRHPPSLLWWLASKIKQTFFSTKMASLMAFEWWVAGPVFSNNGTYDASPRNHCICFGVQYEHIVVLSLVETSGLYTINYSRTINHICDIAWLNCFVPTRQRRSYITL